jgi:hypothetical protein
LEKVFELLVLYFPLSRAEHRRDGREKPTDCLSHAESGARFRTLWPHKSSDAASIVLSGKAPGEARRAAIARL